MLQSEIVYYEKLYSGFAQSHFARPAVRALRAHMVNRILKLTRADSTSRVLSIGCGIGDTEILLAPRVHSIVGIDPSPQGIAQARLDATRLKVSNVRFLEQTLDEVTGKFDVICAIFMLHHLPDDALRELPYQAMKLLTPGGVLYSVDPSVRRLSGAVGRLVVPWLMKKYQTEGERELQPEPTAELFRNAGLDARTDMYDFGSTPVAGLFPGWRFGYEVSRRLDDLLLRVPSLRARGSNFEIVARKH